MEKLLLPNIRKLDNKDVIDEEMKNAEGEPSEGNKMTGAELKQRADIYEESRAVWNEKKII